MNDTEERSFESIVSVVRGDATMRCSCRAGDFMLWLRCANAFAGEKLDMVDMWEMRDGDCVTITNRLQDVPRWFALYSTEMSAATYVKASSTDDYKVPREAMDGPQVWRVRAGDRIVWVGESRLERTAVRGLLAVLDFRECALALGETNRPVAGLEDMIFGAPSGPEMDSDEIARCRLGVDAAQKLGLPRSVATDWIFG